MSKKESAFITKNKKAFFDYEILDTYEAGIMLQGCEIKSIREGHVNLKGSYVSEINEELWVRDIHISPYKFSNDKEYNPMQKRKLLLKKKEVDQIAYKLKTAGITALPLDLHFNKKGMVKVKLGIVRGKKKYDKRESLKRKDQDREVERRLKHF